MGWTLVPALGSEICGQQPQQKYGPGGNGGVLPDRRTPDAGGRRIQVGSGNSTIGCRSLSGRPGNLDGRAGSFASRFKNRNVPALGNRDHQGRMRALMLEILLQPEPEKTCLGSHDTV